MALDEPTDKDIVVKAGEFDVLVSKFESSLLERFGCVVDVWSHPFGTEFLVSSGAGGCW